ncbi:MAG: hemerythrin domain-containing protein [Planctomycetota bacterium]
MTSGDPTPIDPGDPIEVLLAEHRTILQVLDLVERENRYLDAGDALRETFWRDLLRFADEFDAGLHHGKEERLLFPALERAGLSATSGPTALLRDEHGRAAFWRDRLQHALAARDRLRVAAAAASWVDLVRAHVLKENQILFPLARRLLSAAELERLRVAFAALPGACDPRAWLHPGHGLDGAA